MNPIFKVLIWKDDDLVKVKYVAKLNEEERLRTWWTPEEERRFQVEAELEQSAQMGFAPQGAQLFGYQDDVSVLALTERIGGRETLGYAPLFLFAPIVALLFVWSLLLYSAF